MAADHAHNLWTTWKFVKRFSRAILGDDKHRSCKSRIIINQPIANGYIRQNKESRAISPTLGSKNIKLKQMFHILRRYLR